MNCHFLLWGIFLTPNPSLLHCRHSYRGRKRLRYVLYEAAVSVVSHSPEFRSIHQYYTTREKNPLKKMQSMIAVACKLIRVFYLILQMGTTYDAEKLMSDIRRPVAA